MIHYFLFVNSKKCCFMYVSSICLISDDTYEHDREGADHSPADDFMDLVQNTLRLGIDLRLDLDLGLDGVVFLAHALLPSSFSSPMTPALAS